MAFTSGNSPQLWAYTSLTSLHGSNGWTRLGFFQAPAFPGPPSCSQITPELPTRQLIAGQAPAPVNFILSGVENVASVDFLLYSQSKFLTSAPGVVNPKDKTMYSIQIGYNPGQQPTPGAYKLLPRLNGNTVTTGCPSFITFYSGLPVEPGLVSCDSAAGTWSDVLGGGVNSGTWTIIQNALANNSLSGTFSASFAGFNLQTCSATWAVSANASSMNAATGNFSVTALPQSTSDPINCPQSTSITESGNVSGTGCVQASGTLTVTENYHGPQTGTFSWTRPATIPDGETTAFESWTDASGLPTVGQFAPVLTSNAGLNFGGRFVAETQVGTSEDTCDFEGSAFNGFGLTGGGEWSVQDDNSYGVDLVGVFPSVVGYFQYYGPLYWSGGQTSCSGTTTQQMQISTSSLPQQVGQPLNLQNYGTPNTLVITIDQTGTQCTRENASAYRAYSFP